jgi:serine/threonine protein kinase
MNPENAIRIGRYELVAPLGQGGMGRVHLAVSHGPLGFDKLVVVKQLRPELAWDQEFLAMFFDEARIAARLNHPNVVQTYEVVEEAGQYLLAMEYLEGHPLSQVLQRVGRLQMPLELHLWILAQVLAGLHYAHELRDYDGSPLGVVHRDVSPSNVFITYNGDVKLVDFGIAKVAGASSATEQGKVKGKLGYSAPEQLLCKPVDGRADVFAVGVMLWEALAQQRRKLAESPAAIFQARLAGLEPRISEARPEVQAALADICDRAMALETTGRYQTALEMQQALERYLERGPRRVGQREVAALLTQHFADDRRALRQRIESQLGRSVNAPLVVAGMGEARPPEGALPSAPIPAVSLPPPGTPAPSERSQTHPTTSLHPPTRWLPRWLPRSLPRPGRLYVAGGVALLAGAVVGTLLTLPRDSAPVGAAPPVARPAVLQPPPASHLVMMPQAPPARVEPASEPAATVEIVLSAWPSDAKLTLDGRPLAANPFEGVMPRQEGDHVLRASASGFLPAERTISFSEDVDVQVSLRPLHRRSHARRGRAETPRPQVERAKAGSVKAVSVKAVAPEPGMDLARPATARPARASDRLDEKDPYTP